MGSPDPKKTPFAVLCIPLLAVAIAISASVLAIQGWRGVFSSYDHLINIDEAYRLLQGEGLPRKGCLSSLSSYIPPGTCWLLLPGLLTGDFRLHELVGAQVSFFLTVAGVYLLARRCFDDWTAVLAVALYSFSALGLAFGTSLWPRARPEFYVWLTYFTVLWVGDRNSWYLCLALLTYALGMYVCVELAPAALVPVLAWFVYRPPVRAWSLAVALVVSVVVWLPYLSFESERGFIDLRSQLLVRSIYPETAEFTWRAYEEQLERWDERTQRFLSLDSQLRLPPPVIPPDTVGELSKTVFKAVLSILTNVSRFSHNLASNFLWDKRLGPILFAVFLVPLLLYAHQHLRLPAFLTRHRWLSWVGVLFAITGLLANQRVAGWLVRARLDEPHRVSQIRTLQIALIATGIIFILHRPIIRGLARIEKRLARAFAFEEPEVVRNFNMRILLLSLMGPWLFLAIFSTIAYRLWGLWSLQAIVLAAAASYLPRHANWPRWGRVGFAVLIFTAVGASGGAGAHAKGWAQDGFSGEELDGAKVMGYIAEQCIRDGRYSAAVGYHLCFLNFQLAFHEVDPLYKVGADFDCYLEHRYGILNSAQTPQGFSAEDQYRVVQIQPNTDEAKLRFPFCDEEEFILEKQFGVYQVWRRRTQDGSH